MGKKGKQDCLTISASAAGAAAGNALSKHTATIGNLHDLLLAPADTSENQINLWLLPVTAFQLLCVTT